MATPGERAFQGKGHSECKGSEGTCLVRSKNSKKAGVLDTVSGAGRAGDGETEAQGRGKDHPTVARRCR